MTITTVSGLDLLGLGYSIRTRPTGSRVPGLDLLGLGYSTRPTGSVQYQY